MSKEKISSFRFDELQKQEWKIKAKALKLSLTAYIERKVSSKNSEKYTFRKEIEQLDPEQQHLFI